MGGAQVVGIVAALLVGCEQEQTERPGGFFGVSRTPPRLGGSVGGGTDGGVDEDGGAGADGLTIQGRVVLVDDLSVLPADAEGAPDRLVSTFGAAGALVEAVSAADGSFRLEGAERVDPIVLAVSGDPPSFVVLDRDRREEAVVPVVDRPLLEAIASSQGAGLDVIAGHAMVWVERDGGAPLSGVAVEVVSPGPVLGPFYGGFDPVTVLDSPPTLETGLVVLLDGVPGDLELSMFRPEDPAVAERLVLPLDDDIVTFHERTTEL